MISFLVLELIDYLYDYELCMELGRYRNGRIICT